MRIFTSSSYEIYYRKLNSNKPLFLEKNFKGFTKIKVPFFYWAADPFVIEFKGEIYVFAELYHRLLNIGRIAYRKISGGKWCFLTSFNHHFSFPNPVVLGNNLYIIPETSSQRFVGIFNGFNFTKYRTILPNFPGVDSVFHILSNRLYSYNQGTFELFRYYFDVNKNKVVFLDRQKDTNKQLRPAGNIIDFNDELIMPSQNCLNFYGESINFNKIINDKIVKFDSLSAKDINSGLGIKCHGCHTYNFSNGYEIIDVQFFKFNLTSLFGKIILLFRLLFKRK